MGWEYNSVVGWLFVHPAETTVTTVAPVEEEKKEETVEKVMKTVKSAKKSVKPWAVQNVKTGKVATTRESNYNRLALFETRTAAREALKSGKVFTSAKHGKVVRRDSIKK